MKKNKMVKVFAILGLLWILASIIWTGILILTTPSESEVYQVNNETTSVDWQDTIDKKK
jgi:hypothetical protein